MLIVYGTVSGASTWNSIKTGFSNWNKKRDGERQQQENPPTPTQSSNLVAIMKDVIGEQERKLPATED